MIRSDTSLGQLLLLILLLVLPLSSITLADADTLDSGENDGIIVLDGKTNAFVGSPSGKAKVFIQSERSEYQIVKTEPGVTKFVHKTTGVELVIRNTKRIEFIGSDRAPEERSEKFAKERKGLVELLDSGVGAIKDLVVRFHNSLSYFTLVFLYLSLAASLVSLGCYSIVVFKMFKNEMELVALFALLLFFFSGTGLLVALVAGWIHKDKLQAARVMKIWIYTWLFSFACSLAILFGSVVPWISDFLQKFGIG